jgi:ABC-type transporter Mla subunit MlaD
MNENKANYAKIGLFVLSGFALILIVIGIAGARVLSKKSFLVETYFTESVTGLDVGSPVKYSGVPIGEVNRIGFVVSEYGKQTSDHLDSAKQILVVMALDPEKFIPLKNNAPAAFLERLVKDGMRVKLAASGVTGLSFIELDYTRSIQPVPPQPVYWIPNNPYIPSTPSTMVAFKKSIDEVFVKLSQINIQALGDELLATLYLVQGKLLNADIATLSAEATLLLRELRTTNRSIQSLVASPELQQLPGDLAATAGSVRRITSSVETQIEPLANSVRSVTENANRLAEALTGIATNAGGQVQQTAAALNQTAQTLNRTAVSQQDALSELIQNLRGASTSLNQFVSDLRANPSALLFSRPPEPLPETQRTLP